MTEKRRRRKWSDEEKIRIVAQARMPNHSVSQVARRYDVNANLVFRWLRDPRFYSPVDTAPHNAQFLPVEVSCKVPTAEPVTTCSEASGKIEIRLANDHYLALTGSFNVEAVKLLLKDLN